MTTLNIDVATLVVAILNLLVVALTAYYVLRQVSAAKKTLWSHAFFSCVQQLQIKEVVEARGKVFQMIDDKKTEATLTDEDKKQIDWVCRTYDVVGITARWGMIPTEIIVDSWGDSIVRLWPFCLKYRVDTLRKQKKAEEYWDDFQWLYGEAIEFAKDRKRRLKKLRSVQNAG